MSIAISRCFVVVHDVELALGFYGDLLGLQLLNDVAQDTYRWVTLAAPGQEGVAVVLSNYLDGSPADIESVRDLLAKGALNGVHFRADDLDALFDRLVAGGAEALEPPTDQFWGVRDCALRDPSGNVVRIDQG
ncbi:VOC family protein [Micropruina sonneratiae]|uniref:VOC family protein n=1 Tax=Micropruina sonneratiae TaxID=2986940 RepID=UPI002226C3B9|nr:VOC family protein [Micropruina sp. KQZ13P-5]MCW3157616.1 VOC family protein [Micropruina sp. KQZ13P-5]